MSPTPLIELQRRLTVVGAIRAGGEKRDPKKPGAKLEAFRVTSPRKQLVEQAAQLYGGDVTSWTSPSGQEWQTYTEAETLPVLVMPGYSLRQTYELWEGATKRERVCDGIEMEDGSPCICNAEGVDRCDVYTRLVVALPELDTVLGWRLITRGANAAHELPTMFALIESRGTRATFVPARLSLHQRRGVKDGQVVRYVVPTLDLDVGYLGLASPPLDGAGRELAPARGFEPAPRRGPTVGQAIDAVAASPAPSRTGRSAAAFGPDPAIGDEPSPPTQDPTPDFGPEPDVDEPAPSGDVAKQEEGYSDRRQTLHLTEPQAKKLNVLVGKLRPDHITTEQLWASIAGLRHLDVGVMIEALAESAHEHGTKPPRDEQGVLHWAPLRDSLTRPEAVQLIDWLSIKEARVGGGFGERASGVAKTSPSQGDLPEGY